MMAERLSTSPLRGEVAAKRRVGAIPAVTFGKPTSETGTMLTPPRSYAPTLALRGSVELGGLPHA